MSLDVLDYLIISLLVLGAAGLVANWLFDKWRLPVKRAPPDRNRFDPSLVNNVRYQIVPYLVSADRLPKTLEYTAFRFYSYLRAFMAGLIGIGIAPELLRYLNSVATFDPSGSKQNTAIPTPTGLGYVALALAVLMIAFAVYSNQTGLPKRAVLADSCASELRSSYAKLLKLASGVMSSTALDAISNEVSTIVLRHVAEKSWTFEHILAPDIDEEVEIVTNDILQRASANPANLAASKMIDGAKDLIGRQTTIQQEER